MIDTTLDIFCCYAQEDYSFLKGLKTHLVPLQRQGLITIWNDTNVSPGTDRERKIKNHLAEASIIILFISPDFIASDYYYGVEMKSALERHNKGEARILPIIVRPVAWEQTPFSNLQVLPSNGKPITLQRNRDEAFLEIAKGILSVIKEHYKQAMTSNVNNLPIASSSATEDSLGRPHILVVDDDENILNFMRMGCKYEGFDGSFVTSGEDALIFTQVHPPDIVTLDITLGGTMDGLEVLRALRANSHAPARHQHP